jgi:hypothetical protein
VRIDLFSLTCIIDPMKRKLLYFLLLLPVMVIAGCQNRKVPGDAGALKHEELMEPVPGRKGTVGSK